MKGGCCISQTLINSEWNILRNVYEEAIGNQVYVVTSAEHFIFQQKKFGLK